ncbi:P-loop NTPase fold protein [Neptuniibacter sp. PT34_22]|uniref:KAP family P-loop NTPase fold protein n=1 Tax=Neptuniibacter sp. PT34_22 TaxID=3398205 RepID=UPI0039F553C5
MRFHLPEDYSAFEEKGFDADRLGRSDTANLMKAIIDKTEGGLVIGLDAQWGVGKTSFVKMLQADMENNTPFIYFDAYKSDYHHDPITALAGEIYEKAKELELPHDGAMSKVAEAFRKLPKLSLSSGVSTLLRISAILLAKQLGEDDLASAANAIAIAGDLNKDLKEIQTELSVQNVHVENYASEKKALDEIKISLKKLAEDLVSASSLSSDIASSKNIVFVIDELDRCRPDYALSMLEAIKHLFLVPNIVFILVTNQAQLAASIQGVHGSKFDASLYLEKFIGINIALEPIGADFGEADVFNFLANHYEKLDVSYSAVDVQKLSKIVINEKVNVRHLTKIIITLGVLKLSDNLYFKDVVLKELVILVATLNICNKEKLNDLINICREKTNSLSINWLYQNFKTDMFRGQHGLTQLLQLFAESSSSEELKNELLMKYNFQPSQSRNQIKELFLLVISSVTCFNINI